MYSYKFHQKLLYTNLHLRKKSLLTMSILPKRFHLINVTCEYTVPTCSLCTFINWFSRIIQLHNSGKPYGRRKPANVGGEPTTVHSWLQTFLMMTGDDERKPTWAALETGLVRDSWVTELHWWAKQLTMHWLLNMHAHGICAHVLPVTVHVRCTCKHPAFLCTINHIWIC